MFAQIWLKNTTILGLQIATLRYEIFFFQVIIMYNMYYEITSFSHQSIANFCFNYFPPTFVLCTNQGEPRFATYGPTRPELYHGLNTVKLSLQSVSPSK